MICPGCLKEMEAYSWSPDRIFDCRLCDVRLLKNFSDEWQWTVYSSPTDSIGETVSLEEMKRLFPNLERLMKLGSFQ